MGWRTLTVLAYTRSLAEHHSCKVTYRCKSGGRKAIAEATRTLSPNIIVISGEHHSGFWKASQWFLENITVAWAFSSRLGERRAGSAEEAGATPARSTNGLLAQMGERLHRTQEVGGSRPPRSTTSTCGSMSRAPGPHPGGCRGGACQVDQSNTAL